MLPILGSAFWQSMKNKVRKSRKPTEGGTSPVAQVKKWDLRLLLEQEPRMWSACFRTPESFVKIADCVVSMHGIQPVNTHAIDNADSMLGDEFIKLPNLNPAGSVMLVNDRIYISSMDLCRYYWRGKSDGAFDRQMQSWNAGRRAALREKTKSYVHIDESNVIEAEWWDIEGILTSTKVLRKFLVMPEGALALSELARYIYQRRRFYEDSPTLPTSPRESVFVMETDDTQLEMPSVRKRTPSMKADGSNVNTPRKKTRGMRSPNTFSPLPLSPLMTMPVSPIARADWNSPYSSYSSAFVAQTQTPKLRSPIAKWPPSMLGSYFDRAGTDGSLYDQRSAFALRQPSFDGSTSGSSTTTEESATSSSTGLMLLVDAAAARENHDQKDQLNGRSDSRSSRSFSTDSRSSSGSLEEEKEVFARRPSLSFSAGDKLHQSGSIFRSVALQPFQ